MHYYNEFDPRAAAWLRELMAAKLIPEGKIDERDIRDVSGRDLDGFVQCHFFAGIGGWPLALQLAGWPESEPCWTGSCPCQPFSVAGKNRGKRDPRHVWPEFKRLIGERKPAIVFGEQVASKAGRAWLAGVFADLEDLAYACAGADLCAAGVGEEATFEEFEIRDDFSGEVVFRGKGVVGAPHIRQRLWWVGVANGAGRFARGIAAARDGYGRAPGSNGGIDGVADVCGPRLGGWAKQPAREKCTSLERSGLPGATDGVVHSSLSESERQRLQFQHVSGKTASGKDGRLEHAAGDGRVERRPEPIGRGVASGCGWDDFEIIPCRDGKARRIESGSFPLADGFPGRVGLLRGYGNAIVPQLAAEFIKAFREIGR